jgi:hypothetical protein
MRNTYAQVAMTYIRRLLTRGNLLFLFFACSMLLLEVVTRGAHAVAMPLLFAMLVCFGFVVHMVEQFANWRAHLLPTFRRAHAVVAAVATCIVIIALSAILARLGGGSVVASIAIVLLLFGTTLWSLTGGLARPRGNPRSAVDSVGGALLMVAWVVVFPIGQFLSGQFELQAIILSCMLLVMILLRAVQLFRLHDDVPEAQSSLWGLTSRIWRKRGRTLRAGLPKLDERTAKSWLVFSRFDGHVERLAEHARRASTSRWSAVCRWRVGMANGRASWLFGVGVVLAVQFAAWIAVRETLEPSTFFWLTFLFWLIASPSFMSLSQLVRRNHQLGYEIMLPVQRRIYLKQVGMAVAVSWLRKWGGMCAVFMLWWITAASEPLRLGLVVNVLACSALAQVGLFGMVLCLAWLAQREPPERLPLLLPLVVGAIGGVVSIPIALVAVMLNESPLLGLGNFLLPLGGAALFAMFGLLLTWFAYRRWLVADFD